MQIDLLESMELSSLSTDELLKLSKDVRYIAEKECYKIGIKYNRQDVQLVENLDKKLNFIKVALTMTYMAKVKHKDIFGQVKFWDTYLYNFANSKNKQIPPETRSDKSDNFAGAFVKEPIPGRYKWVVSFDLNSLYPSIMMQYNMSPETLFKKASGNYVEDLIKFNIDTKFLKDKNLTMVANGTQFRKDKWGFIPEIVEFLYSERRNVKNQMLKSESESEQIKGELKNRKNNKIEKFSDLTTDELKEKYKNNRDLEASLNAYQMALKISLNSLYGASGNVHFRYFSLDIAEGITLTGQMTIRYISEKLNILLNNKFKTNNIDYVVANDTDSVVGSTMIEVNHEKSTISDFYDSIPDVFVKKDEFNQQYVKKVDNNYITPSINSTGKLENKSISYIMKHKVKKQLYKIIDNKGNEVIITNNHSIIVQDKKTKKILSILPEKLDNKKYKIINISIANDTDTNVYENKTKRETTKNITV
ncbi:MAG: DNA polymerase domain-containing protein [Flavobacterium sp.]|uniref:DNA polymerase domain-containing protein n=1 Tax=Flavobacterium sp. TaxID=239 RepID=UPI00261F42B6|nr:DNA polymerase domain-containing protein [Flavobacterium sp.]MDD5150425.1 DNA polymerase domain-containing protein [Flavobacterium sp.]